MRSRTRSRKVPRRMVWVPTVAFDIDMKSSTQAAYDSEPGNLQSVQALGGTLDTFQPSTVSSLAQRDFDYTIERVVGRAFCLYRPPTGTPVWPVGPTLVKLGFCVVPMKAAAGASVPEIDLFNMFDTNLGKRMGRLPFQMNWAISEENCSNQVGPYLSFIQGANQASCSGPVTPEFDFKPRIRCRQNQSVQWLCQVVRPPTSSGGDPSEPVNLDVRVYPRLLIAYDE